MLHGGLDVRAVRGRVAALLALEAGPECAAAVPRGQRLAAAAAHAVDALHRLQHVPDVDLGEHSSQSTGKIFQKCILKCEFARDF